ncbi:hypothetical protein [Streptomyces sp. NBC_00019]|uniref:hypothetical protein n=1 Tax=Streptomyces sp. NBC_00019 TaxID=2975623 RepID=UPI003243CDD0
MTTAHLRGSDPPRDVPALRVALRIAMGTAHRAGIVPLVLVAVEAARSRMLSHRRGCCARQAGAAVRPLSPAALAFVSLACLPAHV